MAIIGLTKPNNLNWTVFPTGDEGLIMGAIAKLIGPDMMGWFLASLPSSTLLSSSWRSSPLSNIFSSGEASL
jgi:hypothetical protein